MNVNRWIYTVYVAFSHDRLKWNKEVMQELTKSLVSLSWSQLIIILNRFSLYLLADKYDTNYSNN